DLLASSDIRMPERPARPSRAKTLYSVMLTPSGAIPDSITRQMRSWAYRKPCQASFSRSLRRGVATSGVYRRGYMSAQAVDRVEYLPAQTNYGGGTPNGVRTRP